MTVIPWVSVFLGGLLGAFLVEGVLRKKSFFEPWRVFFFSQVSGLCIAYLRLNPDYMTPWRWYTWFIFLSSLGAFGIGSFIAYRLPIPNDRDQVTRSSEGLIQFSLLALSLWVFAGAFAGYLAAGTWPILAEDPALAQKAFTSIRYVLIFGVYNSPLIFCSSVAIIFMCKSWRWRVIAAIAAAQAAAVYVLVGTRNPILLFLFVLGYVYDQKIAKLGYLRIAGSLTAFVCLFLAMALLKIGVGFNFGWVAELPPSEIRRFGLGLITPLYEYIGNCYWNLDYALGLRYDGMGHPMTWGTASLDGLLSFFKLAEPLQSSFGWDSIFNETSKKVYHLNTVTYHWTVYKDFGAVGVFVFSVFWGGLANYIHRRAIGSQDQLIVAFSACFQFSVFFSFFAFYFVIQSYLIALFFFVVARATIKLGIRNEYQ